MKVGFDKILLLTKYASLAFFVLQVDIKVRHLLSHLSGVRHYEKDYMNQVGYVEKHSFKK